MAGECKGGKTDMKKRNVVSAGPKRDGDKKAQQKKTRARSISMQQYFQAVD